MERAHIHNIILLETQPVLYTASPCRSSRICGFDYEANLWLILRSTILILFEVDLKPFENESRISRRSSTRMSDADSDEWATESLPDMLDVSNRQQEAVLNNADGFDDGWETKLPVEVVVTEAVQSEQSDPGGDDSSAGEPMILVDLTELTDGAIHSRFDAHSVNDPEAVKKWRLTADYATLSKDANLLACRTVIPCGSSVWSAALATLRRERHGHYFSPLFPPKL
jgi:hypothetical protein